MDYAIPLAFFLLGLAATLLIRGGWRWGGRCRGLNRMPMQGGAVRIDELGRKKDISAPPEADMSRGLSSDGIDAAESPGNGPVAEKSRARARRRK